MANTNKKPTKAQELAAVQALVAGTQKHDPNGSYEIGSVVYTSAQLITLLQSLVAAMIAQTTAQQAAKDALTALEAVKAKVDPVMNGYRSLLLTAKNGASQTLGDYGLTPRKKRTPLTVEQKAAALAKRNATRAAHAPPTAKPAAAPQGTTTAPAEPAPAAPAASPPKATS